MATNYDINYDDERFQQVEADKNAALSEVEKTYGGMINESDKYYQAQIDASKQWADKQSQLQQENTDFAIEQIEQQKDQAKKDYTKEQSGAYVDWQKQSNQYGANAEQMAAQGMAGTGFSESSQVSMYNTYQNRVVSARESYNRAVLNYDNAIKDARLQNNSILAEIAYQAQQTQLGLALEGFQYKNQLVTDQMNKKLEVDQIHYQRWQDVLSQMNTENALAEEVRQYEKSYAENVRQFNQNYNLEVKKFDESIRQFEEEIARLKKKDEREYQTQIQELELKKKQAEEAKRQFEEEQKLKREQLAEQKRQFDSQYSLQQAQIKKNSSRTGSKGTVRSYKPNATSSGGVVKDGATARATLKDDGDAGGDPIITNRHGDSWIEIPGHGRFSITEVYAYVKDGTIKETISNGKATYKWVGKKSKSGVNVTPDAKGYAAKQKELMRNAW